MTLVYVLYAHPFKKIGEEVLHALYLCCHSLTLWCTTVHTKSESGSECCCAFVSTNREKGRWLWQNVNQTSLHLNSGYERITEADRQHFHWSGIKLFDTIWGKKSKAGSCMMKICVLWLRCFLARLFHEHRVCAVLVWQHCLRRDKKKKLSRKSWGRGFTLSTLCAQFMRTVHIGNYVLVGLSFYISSSHLENYLSILPHQSNLCLIREKSYFHLKQICDKQQWKSPLSSKYCTLVKYCKCRYSGRLYQILPSAFLLFLNSDRSSKRAL